MGLPGVEMLWQTMFFRQQSITAITMKTTYMTQGTCCQAFDIETEDGKVKDVKFYGGCNGNLQGICSLIKDMPVDDVIARLKGIRCGAKPTSCPDQLATALRQMKEAEE